MRLPRIVRPGNGRLGAFVPAAAPGEWAVTGAFRFAHRDPATIRQRELHVFKHGWLGLESFGSGALVEVADLAEPVHEELGRRLAAYLMTQYGSNPGAAVEAARLVGNVNERHGADHQHDTRDDAYGGQGREVLLLLRGPSPQVH